MNIFSNYIPNKFITIDDKDPPWMNEYIMRELMDKKVACESFNMNNKSYDAYFKLRTVSTELSEMILKQKMIININSQTNSTIQRQKQKHTGLF